MGVGKPAPSPWPSRIAGLLLLALVVQAGWVTGSLSSRMLAPASSIPDLYSEAAHAGSRVAQLADLSVSELNFFGVPQSEMEVPEAISESAPETRLRLVLHGIAMAERPEESSAIVAGGPGGETQWYRVGDTLPGDARLVEVRLDRILLRREGRIETLRFPEEEAPSLVAAEPSGGDRPQTKEAFVAEAQSRLSENPSGALASVGFRPRPDGEGYVYDGSNPMLNGMNLKEGDVVLAINGHQLGDMAADRALIDRWSELGELRVEVERGGGRFSITVPLP